MTTVGLQRDPLVTPGGVLKVATLTLMNSQDHGASQLIQKLTPIKSLELTEFWIKQAD